MMTQAFYTGISGIRNNATGIDVVSNNLANVSTVGFRGYEAEFSSIFENSVATTSGYDNTVGVGVQVQTTSMIEDEGSLMLSDKSTDVAIVGEGWFGLSVGDSTVYTRDGNFNFDTNRDLVTADGLHVLGTLAGNISADNVLTQKLGETPLGAVATQQELNFPDSLTYPAEATSSAEFTGNVGVGYDPVVISASVIDPNGSRNQLKLEFTKNATQVLPGSQYTLVATTQSVDGETVYDTQTGTVEFDSTGALISNSVTSIGNNGATVAINLGENFDGVIAQDTLKISGSSKTDGTPSGSLIGYTINDNADVIASFSNGEYSSVGKLAVFHFQNDQGLGRISGTRFEETSNSGDARFYQDENGNNINGSKTLSYKLESSNIELSYGLTELIILQRAYDANSKSVTTADQMMQKALDMDA